MKTYEVKFVHTDYDDGEEPEARYIQIDAKDMAEAVINTRKRFGDCVQIIDIKEVYNSEYFDNVKEYEIKFIFVADPEKIKYHHAEAEDEEVATFGLIEMFGDEIEILDVYER